MYYSKCDKGYVLRLDLGEEIQEALRQFAKAVDLKSAFYQGLGAVNQVELAFFCTENCEYDKKFFDAEYELTSLVGNLTLHEGVFIPHTHITIGDRDFQTYSGHLVRAVVSVTVELLVTPIDLTITRKKDPILQFEALISPRRTHLKVDV